MLLTDSPTLHARQSAGFDQTIAKATRELAELRRDPATRQDPPRTGRREAAVARICKPRWLGRVLRVELSGETRRAAADLAGRHRRAQSLETELFGKRLLVTDRDDWPVVELVAGYRSQSDAEGGFRQPKDPKVVSFSPMWHWTDQKIRVRVSYCVTAIAVAHLMRRETDRAGLHLSVR